MINLIYLNLNGIDITYTSAIKDFSGGGSGLEIYLGHWKTERASQAPSGACTVA